MKTWLRHTSVCFLFYGWIPFTTRRENPFLSQLLKNTQRCGWSFDGSLAFRAAPVGPDPPVVANGKVLPQAQWQWGSSSVYYCVEASLHDKYNKDSSIYKSNTVDLNWNKDKYITVGLIEDIF